MGATWPGPDLRAASGVRLDETWIQQKKQSGEKKDMARWPEAEQMLKLRLFPSRAEWAQLSYMFFCIVL